MWVVEPAEIQTDLLSAKTFKSTKQRIVPVRVLILLAHEKVICKNSEVGLRAPVEAVINSEQSPEPAEMSEIDVVLSQVVNGTEKVVG